MTRLAVFAYGSLVSRASLVETLGEDTGEPVPARLHGWRRRWTLVRDNARAEKGFAPLTGAPFDFCLGLNLERTSDPAAPPVNGALIALDQDQLERLDLRELRYERRRVAERVTAAGAAGFDAVYTYTARPENHAPAPPPRAVVLASYVRAIEAAFAELGPGEPEAFRRSTDPPPVPVVEARLVRDRIPTGNPRAW